MKIKVSKIIFAFLLSFTLCLTQCGGGSGGNDESSPSGSGGDGGLVTASNVLGTWIASSGSVEDFASVTVSAVDGFDDRVTVLVVYSDGSTDTGVVFFTEDDETGFRSVTIELSAGTLTGSVSVSDDCQAITVSIDGETGTFTNNGNTCTDT